MIMRRYRFVYYIIFLLTVLDIAFTVTGLQLGIITEANPIIDYFISLSMGLTFLFIMGYVGAVLILIYKASPKIHWLNTAMAGLAGIKLYIVIIHIGWISKYLAGNI